ncbi:MAG TPA: site-2 protease family protein [Pyrinomonadaceae bacterium]|nr:site-2 protease family protein [Pyrinomonadaceae bacterium]
MSDPTPFTLSDDLSDPALRPTARTWVKHTSLLLVTFATMTIAGVLFPFGSIYTLPEADPQTFSEAVRFVGDIPIKYISLVAYAISQLFTNAALLRDGLSFSLSLLFILISHEMGHYIACRIYRVDATLPYFIPTPPMIGPAGTFGAFIKILAPMPSRKAVFDIGVAGPIAGFVALIPVAIMGMATMQVATPEQVAAGQGSLIFTDPLFMRILAMFYGIDLTFGIGNPFYFAAWVGLLVTALNLIPSGQLDGGHAIYAVFGERVHYWSGRIAFITMATCSVLGWFYFNSPSGFLIAVLLGIMMRVKHPTPWDLTPLDIKRKAVAFLCLIIFILCFVPFPIQIN